MHPDPGLDQKLTWDQIRRVDAHPRFTVGGHSHTHRVLEFLDDVSLESEVATSLDLLQRHLGRPVRHYSYPEGLEHCYSARVIRVLRAHGVVCAPSAIPGLNRPGSDLFHLRRIPVV
jgi:peptidoglycan/xylan/chitin deacetylase (PgdA/CDA1 family)